MTKLLAYGLALLVAIPAAHLSGQSASESYQRMVERHDRELKDIQLALCPIGTILAWSPPTAGTVGAPANWAICDGEQGTPNLTDRFLLGREISTIRRGDARTGGSKTIPMDGAHNHGGDTGSTQANPLDVYGVNFKAKDTPGTTNFVYPHTHGIQSVSDHNHGGSLMPPYYTVVYVMRMK